MPSAYETLDDVTFRAMIHKDMEQIRSATRNRIFLMYANAPNEVEGERRWAVNTGGSSAVTLDNHEIAGFCQGALAAIVAMRENQCGKEFMAGARCVLPKGHSSPGHNDGS